MKDHPNTLSRRRFQVSIPLSFCFSPLLFTSTLVPLDSSLPLPILFRRCNPLSLQVVIELKIPANTIISTLQISKLSIRQFRYYALIARLASRLANIS